MSEDQAAVKVARGLVAGVIAGAVAAFAMDRFQAVVSPLLPASGDDSSPPATEQAADAVAQRTAGHSISPPERPLAGQAIHYAVGIGLGVAYGIAAEFRPAVAAAGGTGFALVTATLLDEAAVPALGLGPAPWRSDGPTLLYGYASHLVFGGVAEFVRARVAATLTD